MLIVGFLNDLYLPSFFYTTQDHLHREWCLPQWAGLSHIKGMVWAVPHHLLIKTTPQRLAVGQSNLDSPWAEVSFSNDLSLTFTKCLLQKWCCVLDVSCWEPQGVVPGATIYLTSNLCIILDLENWFQTSNQCNHQILYLILILFIYLGS